MENTTITPTQPAVVLAIKEILTSFGFKQDGYTWRLGRVQAQIGEYPRHNAYRVIFTRGKDKSYGPFFGLGLRSAHPKFGQKKWLKGELRKALRKLHEDFAEYPSEKLLAIPHNLR